MRSTVFRIAAPAIIAAMVGACGGSPLGVTRYTPRVRELTITTVPLLVKEAVPIYPFLAPDFARGGVLEGKEVYGFSPGTLTVVAGDTIHFIFINPEDDPHSFVLPDAGWALPPQQITKATYVARRAGIYSFVCSVPNHLPMMSGQLVVLDPGALGSGSSAPRRVEP